MTTRVPLIPGGTGQLINLVDPTAAQDAATKNYVDTRPGGGAPGAPINSVQFNNNGAFGGSSLLLWDGTALNTNNITSFSGSNLALKSPTSIIDIGNGQANFIRLISSASNVEPLITSTGSDANINLILAAKGSGGISLGQLSDPTPLIAADNAIQTALTPGAAGQVLTSAGPGKTPYWGPGGGGGGGGTFATSAAWGSGGTSKDAYTSPGVVNNQSIVISLIASSGAGAISNATVTLGGVALTNTYASTGSWPNLIVTVPAADITGNAAQTANSVVVGISGIFAGAAFNVSSAGLLTNLQPIAFATTLTASYGASTLPYYTTTAAINYAYSNSSAITSFGGVITPTGGTAQNATSPSGTFAAQPINGAAISGSATGQGQNGAGSSTVSLSGSVTPVSIFVPAFYQISGSSINPTWTTSTTQTAGAAQGSVITYPLATAATQYAWIATQRPLANILYRTPFGDVAAVPDATFTNVTIGSQNFSVYGFTKLSTTSALILVVN